MRDRPSGPAAVFVYGTLMRGECRHGVLARHLPRDIDNARVAGRLVHLGEYPALVDLYASTGEVVGEIASFADVAALLEELDDIEDYLGPGVPGSLYHRVMVEVTTDDGETRMAWTYVWARPVGDAPTIASGDWRTRRPLSD